MRPVVGYFRTPNCTKNAAALCSALFGYMLTSDTCQLKDYLKLRLNKI